MELGEIDARVRALVQLLNDLPGIYTFSSCGGHVAPQEISQVAEDSFYVNFEVEPAPDGWRSLEFVTWAVGEADTAFTVTAWFNGIDPVEDEGCLSFELRGTHTRRHVLEHLLAMRNA